MTGVMNWLSRSLRTSPCRMANFGSSPKIWQNKADFDAKVPPVSKAIADVKGKVTDVASLKIAFDQIQAKCTDCHEAYRLKLK